MPQQYSQKKQNNQQKLLLREQLPKSSIKEEQLNHLQASYGLKAFKIIESASATELEPLSEVIPICSAEIHWAITQEHATTPTDVLARRCRLAMVDIEEAKRLLPIVQEHLVRADLPSGKIDLNK